MTILEFGLFGGGGLVGDFLESDFPLTPVFFFGISNFEVCFSLLL